jgi:hypothetical protein
MQIYVKYQPPARVIEFVQELFQDADVDSVSFFRLHPDDHEHITNPQHDFITGQFDPKTKEVEIYLEGCLRNRLFLDQGFLWPAASWLMVMRTIFHEYWHAKQLQRDSLLVNAYPELIASLDEEADNVAMESLLEWCKDEPMPKLSEMGWMGSRLQEAVNALYYKLPRIIEEFEDFEDGGVMRLEDAFRNNDFTINGMKLLSEKVKEGSMGVVTRNGLCLNGYEALGM